MKKSQYILNSFLSALGVLGYVCLIGWLLFNGENIFGKQDSFIMPILLLLLLIISASITGLLVLGKPIHLYLNGLKKQGITLFLVTLGWLAIFSLVIIVFLLIK